MDIYQVFYTVQKSVEAEMWTTWDTDFVGEGVKSFTDWRYIRTTISGGGGS